MLWGHEVFMESLKTCPGSHNNILSNYLIRPKKNALVFGNAGDEKSLHPGHRKFNFLIDFPGIIPFLL